MFAQVFPIVVWIVTLGLVYALYRRSQMVRSTPSIPADGLSDQMLGAIEYYWRPG